MKYPFYAGTKDANYQGKWPAKMQIQRGPHQCRSLEGRQVWLAEAQPKF
jgi:hypothetical protein